mgnify:CR=1 FL=1
MTTKYYLKEKCHESQLKSFPYLNPKDCPICEGKGFIHSTDITELMEMILKRIHYSNFGKKFFDLIEVVEE